MFSLSLGARCPSPLITLPGTIEIPAAATALFLINSRLDLFILFGFYNLFFGFQGNKAFTNKQK
jgi:hypothetical protein